MTAMPKPGPCGCTARVWCPQHFQALPKVDRLAWQRLRRQEARDATPQERGHVPADALGAELDRRFVESTAAWQARQDARRAERAAFAEARRHGLKARHAQKLRQLRRDGDQSPDTGGAA